MNTTRISAAAALLLTSTLATAQWRLMAPASAPTARVGSAMTFDLNVAGALLFGGGTPTSTNQTWTYDGTTWTQQTPATSPSARFGMQLVYDWNRGVSVLYGGWSSPFSIGNANNETWEYDGTTWTQATPVASPGGRYWYGACYDMGRGRTVLHGGVPSGLPGASNQTWEYDGTTWTQIATVGNPGALERPAMCYSNVLSQAVLFGGVNYSLGGVLTNATWLYNGTTWTLVPIAGPVPSPRNAATLVYDNDRGVCVLTGGQDMSGPLGDTWELNGLTWTQVFSATQPVRDHVSAFLPGIRKVVKFGGFVAAPNTLTNNTWEYGAWNESYGTGCPGTFGVPLLVANQPARISESFSITLSNLHLLSPIGIFAFSVTQLPGIPLDLYGMPGCLLWTAPDFVFSVGAAAGTSTFTWNPVMAVVGDVIYAQGMSLDPVNAFGATVSNAVKITIGH